MNTERIKYLMNRAIKYPAFFDEHNIKLNNVVDVGAQAGQVSLLCLKRNPQARVLAIEPVREHFEDAKEVIGGYKNVILVKKAVARYKGTRQIRFRMNPSGFFSSGHLVGLDPKYDVLQESEEVETDTLLNILNQFGFQHVDFMKIDIEGAEVLLIDDLKEIVKFTNCFNIELFEYPKEDHYEILKIFSDEQFRCFDELRGIELFSLEGVRNYLRLRDNVPTLWYLKNREDTTEHRGLDQKTG